MPAVSIWWYPLAIGLSTSILLSTWAYRDYLKTLGPVKSTRMARRLRPIARERARLMAMREGDEVFYGGHLHAIATIEKRGDMKPYPHHFFKLKRSGVDIFQSALYANSDRFHYTLWEIQFDSRPKRRIRLENRIRRAQRRKVLREMRTNK